MSQDTEDRTVYLKAREAQPGEKEYLGDGVYVRLNEAHQLEVTTENGICATNTIYLEPEVYDALEGYVRRLKAAISDQRRENLSRAAEKKP